MRSIIVALFAVALLAPAARADDLAAAKAFFEDYVRRGEAYDTSIAGLYADNVDYRVNMILPDGKVQTQRFAGPQVRQLVQQTLPLAAQKNIKADFSNVAYQQMPQGVRVTATVFSNVLCYRDPAYSMLIVKNTQGTMQIGAENFNMPVTSRCAR